MTDPMREYSRRQFLKVTAAAGAAVGVGGFLAACSAAVSSAPAASSAASAAASAGCPGISCGIGCRVDRRRRLRHVQLDDLGRPLVPGPARRHRRGQRHQGQQHAVQRQHRRLHEAQAGRRPARHGVGRRAVGPPLLRVRADRGVGHQLARRLQAALLDRPVVPDLDQAGRLPRLPVRVVAGPGLLRPQARSRRPPIRGRSCSTRSTRSGSSSRTSRSRSWPTWASSPAPRTPTA